MTVQELIEQLQDIDPHKEVHIWVNGERLPISLIDDWDAGNIDINAEP